MLAHERKSVPLVIPQLPVQGTFRGRGKKEPLCIATIAPHQRCISQTSEFHCYPVKLTQCFQVKACLKGGGFSDTGIKTHYVDKTLQE